MKCFLNRLLDDKNKIEIRFISNCIIAVLESFLVAVFVLDYTYKHIDGKCF